MKEKLFSFTKKVPDSWLLTGFHKYPKDIFGEGGGGLLLDAGGQDGVGRQRRERREERYALKGQSGGVCDEMRCEVFPQSACRHVKHLSSW